MIDTITYSETSQGWTSRWSYRPEWMVGLNSIFYSFKGGSLYQHDANIVRTRFYNTTDGFSIKTIINQSPMESKMYKSLALDSTHPLNVTGSTDLDTVYMNVSQFSKKEGDFFAYIRRPVSDNNLQMISAQGVGIIDSIAGFELTMDTQVSNASTGDLIISGIVDSNNNLITSIQVGYVVDVVGNVISVSSNNPPAPVIPTPGFINSPSPGSYVYILKGPVAESYGARGRYLDLSLSLNGSAAEVEVELFAISTSAFKSFP
jgi:hypothetical protein